MKDDLPRSISQHISLQKAYPVASPVTSAFTSTVSVFSEFDDILIWRWSTNEEYFAYSVYKVIIEAGRIKCEFMEVWKAATHLKVMILSQLFLKDRLMTRERLQRLGINCEV